MENGLFYSVDMQKEEREMKYDPSCDVCGKGSTECSVYLRYGIIPLVTDLEPPKTPVSREYDLCERCFLWAVKKIERMMEVEKKKKK